MLSTTVYLTDHRGRRTKAVGTATVASKGLISILIDKSSIPEITFESNISFSFLPELIAETQDMR